MQSDREAEARDKREGMRRVDRKRRQQRKDVVEEVILDPRPLGLGDVAAIDQHDTDVGQNAAQVAPDRLLIACELRDRFIDEDELFGWAAAIRTALGDPFAHLRLDAGHPNHKKFIKVIGRNRQKPHPLEHGMPGIDRFLEHPAIEMQPGQLAVDEPFGARGDRRGNFGIGFFFFYFNSLYGFHQVSIHLGARKHHHLTNATQSMCYRDDVSMTLTFQQPAPSKTGIA